MLPTTKDPYLATESEPEAAVHSNIDSVDGAGQIRRRTDAVGTEIPVVVHASRYSSAAPGAGKNSKPVHEETRTVIVFPNGAVVRVSASMAAGELVVLTNQQTGADVICRVVNVKTQPGIQNYVNLEFTQRAPGFWDANVPSERNRHLESPLPVPVLPAPAAAETRLPMPQTVTLNSPLIAISAKTAADSSSPAASTLISEKPRSSEVLSVGLPETDSKLIEKPYVFPSDAAARTSATGAPNELSSSKKILLVVGASILLLMMGAAGGFWLFHNNRPSGILSQAAVNSNAQSIPLPPVTSDQDDAIPPQRLTTADSATLQSGDGTTGARAQSTLPTVQPASISTPREQHNDEPDGQPHDRSEEQPGIAPARPVRYPSIAVEKLSAPIAKAPSVRESVEAPPMLANQASALAGSNALGGGLPSEAPRISAPAVPPRIGGQIQPAKPLAASAPLYPSNALEKHIEGVVTIDAELDNTGRVISMKVISGPSELQVAALNALRKWKYQPAMLDGLAVGSHTQVSISFRLPSSSGSAQR